MPLTKRHSKALYDTSSSSSKRFGTNTYVDDSLMSNLQEKQAEAIIEKLCQQFRLTKDPQQWRDIAYCLSLLPYKSEKSVKKLTEGIQFYRDKLHEPVVFKRFTEILTKVRPL
jgi:hypothetical protein